MILIAFGTRPEYIKLKCFINELKENNLDYQCVFIKQHDKSFVGIEGLDFKELLIDSSNSNRLNQIVSDVCKKLEFPKNTKLVVVQGDTATSFAVALAAFNNGIPVAHIEAGLRTWDLRNPYPEEGYRRMIDSISDFHFCPTLNDFNNLLTQPLSEKSYVTGNTVIDSMPEFKEEKTNEVYITLHRRENHPILNVWFEKLEELATLDKETKFIFIKHPNPNVTKHLGIFKNVKVIEPMPHSEMLKLIAQKAKLLITDSGGLQEEASHYNKFCIVCRKVTERPSDSSVCIDGPEELIEVYMDYKDHSIISRGTFGDGTSSKQIVEILKSKNYENI